MPRGGARPARRRQRGAMPGARRPRAPFSRAPSPPRVPARAGPGRQVAPPPGHISLSARGGESSGENRGRVGRAGARIWGKARAPGQNVSRGTPDAVNSASPPPRPAVLGPAVHTLRRWEGGKGRSRGPPSGPVIFVTASTTSSARPASGEPPPTPAAGSRGPPPRVPGRGGCREGRKPGREAGSPSDPSPGPLPPRPPTPAQKPRKGFAPDTRPRTARLTRR